MKNIFFLIICLTGNIFCFGQVNLLPYQSFSIGSYSECIALGDINNDKLLDVVVVNGNSGGSPFDYNLVLYYQLNIGDLSAPAYVVYPSGAYWGATTVGIGDVNNDSLNDIVIGYSDSIMIFYQSQGNNGVFDSTSKIYSGPQVDALEIDDINNDNLLDIIVTHFNTNYLRIFYQTDTKSWDIKDYPAPNTGYVDMEIEDINNDNLKDLLFVSPGGGERGFYIMRQLSEDVFASAIRYDLEEPYLSGLAVQDINNDQLPDILITQGGNSPVDILIYYNDGTSNFFESAYRLPTYDIPEPISVTDLNCDGSMEIIVAHGGWHALTVYDKIPYGNYIDYQKFNNIYGNYRSSHNTMAIGDLNGDLAPDIALASGSSNWVLFYNDSKPYVSDSVDIRLDTTVYTYSYIYTDSTILNSNSSFQVAEIETFNVIDTIQYIYGYNYIFHKIEGEICSGYYHDSLTMDSTYYHEEIYLSDTFLISSKYDTIYFVNNISNINDFENIRVFPNPASGKINIQLKSIQEKNNIKLYLYNSLGQLIHFEENIFNNHSINIDYKGSLILKLISDNEIISYQIMNY